MNELVNSCRFLGNLGRDPESQYLPSGTLMVKFSVAVNERKSQNGEYVNATTWVDLVAFAKTAELAQRLLKKGSKVLVDAQYGKSSYEDRDGNKRTGHNFTVRNFQIVSGGKSKEEAEAEAGDSDNSEDFALAGDDEKPF